MDGQHETSEEGGAGVPREVNVLALIKGNDHYVYVYDEESRAELLRHFREQAAEESLSLTWFDAAVLTEKAWEQACNNAKNQRLAG
jgi:hypothetical protein